jgi:hypothetical protein
MLPQIHADWAQHVTYGVVAAVAGALLARLVGAPAWVGALVCASVVGIAKEIFDLATGRGQPSVADAIATAAGALPAVAATAHFPT